MKTITFLIAMLFVAGLNNSFAQDTWTQKVDFGGIARGWAVGFSIGVKGYIGMGELGGLAYAKDFWEYDPASNTWTQKADFGGGNHVGAAGFSIGSKGYVGTGHDGTSSTKDFWEYDPASNTWTQKADFGGTARYSSVGFSIGSKGYIGTGNDDNFDLKDFWEYDPATNTWTQKVDFRGTARRGAVGFSIGSKGYIGTGIGGNRNVRKKDLWEYDPASNTWTQKADFGGDERASAAGFSIGSKGYLGSGFTIRVQTKDFWEYDPAANIWTRKADLGRTARTLAVGFSIGNKGYIGTGSDVHYNYTKDFWEYTPENTCIAPINLRVPRIADTAAVLKWNVLADTVSSFRIRYRIVGDDTTLRRYKTGTINRVILTGLQPNTTYEWQLKTNCVTDTTDWVSGPNFTTLSSTVFSSDISTINSSKVHVQIMPNPNKGNFTVQMHLSDKSIATTFSLYNNLGEKIWQQDAGKLNGSASINIALENKLPAGMYVLIILQGDTRLMQKVVVSK